MIVIALKRMPCTRCLYWGLSLTGLLYVSPQWQDRTIYINGQKIKKEREAKIRAVERRKAARREFVRISDKQGEALHTFLSDPETQAIFDKKCPPGTHQRALYEVCFFPSRRALKTSFFS